MSLCSLGVSLSWWAFAGAFPELLVPQGRVGTHGPTVSSVPGGGQGASGGSGWAGMESQSQQGYWWLAEGHGCMGRAEAGVRGAVWKTTSAGCLQDPAVSGNVWIPLALQVAALATASLPFSGHW